MKELKCPECGHVFSVDPETYRRLTDQVRTAEFEAEVDRRLADQVQMLGEHHKLDLEKLQHASDNAAEQARRQADRQADKIRALEEKIAALQGEHTRDIENQLLRQQQQQAAERLRLEQEISQLKGTVENADTLRQMALLQQQAENEKELHQRDALIAQIKAEADARQREAERQEDTLRQQHAQELKQRDETIQYYKDLKQRLSTKMVGETLEQHCAYRFTEAQSMGLFPDAVLNKDNDASGGTKGDFIFRDYIDGTEYISIMFEMKNENETTATKHRNEDFLEKLNKDRNDKNCEYAVLVSMLERDNDLYNDGIVNMSHRYPRMYVIRPQMFVAIISLLTQATRRNIGMIQALRVDLEVARAQSIDVTHFEERRDRFAENIAKLFKAHNDKHDRALEDIDKIIAALEKQISSLRAVKTLFDDSTAKLARATQVIENDFTIKKLVHGNPTMRQKFEQARQDNQNLPDTQS